VVGARFRLVTTAAGRSAAGGCSPVRTGRRDAPATTPSAEAAAAVATAAAGGTALAAIRVVLAGSTSGGGCNREAGRPAASRRAAPAVLRAWWSGPVRSTYRRRVTRLQNRRNGLEQ
jgi:hypothetical protein